MVLGAARDRAAIVTALSRKAFKSWRLPAREAESPADRVRYGRRNHPFLLANGEQPDNRPFPRGRGWGMGPPIPRRDVARKAPQRIPGNIPFMPRIIFCIPPLENCFIIFCVCSN